MIEALDQMIDACEKFAGKEIVEDALRADLERDGGGIPALWEKSREIGLPGLLVPDSCGGAGLPPGVAAMVLEVFASRCAGVASLFAFHFAACSALPGEGTPWANRLERLSGAAPGPCGMATVIFPSGEGEAPLRIRGSRGGMQLSGESGLVGNAEHADCFCLFVEEERGGVSCLLLDRETPGLRVGENAELPGLKVNAFSPLTFQETKVPASCIVGERGGAGDRLEKVTHLFFGLIAAMAMGAGRAAHEKALAYAGQRYQFGKIILQHQEIQRMLGAMRMKLDVGTAACLRLFREEPQARHLPAPDPALVKAYCTEAALEIALDAVQVHGGYGYMHEYGVEKIMRDAKVLHLLGGSTPSLQIGAVAREINVG